MSTPVYAIILAAGQGTRMKSATPKVLHQLAGRSMLDHAIRAVVGLQPAEHIVVVRHERDRVVEHLEQVAPHAKITEQDEIAGTGRAVESGLTAIPDAGEGTLLVTYGDVPLLSTELLQNLLAEHLAASSHVTILTAQQQNPFGYGRIIRDPLNGAVLSIVEEKDATDEQRKVTEVNSGIYAFDLKSLRDALPSVVVNELKNEKYLTDVVKIVREAGGVVHAVEAADPTELDGVNDRVQLAAAAEALNRRIVEKWQRAGVTVVDPRTTWIDDSVQLAADVTILPGTQLHGTTTVQTGSVIGPDTTLEDVQVGAGTSVVRTHGSQSVIGADATVGPFSYLRPGTVLGDEGKIGTFVETKKATIGAGSKIPHLTYVGDATIGEQSNIGASSVFVNYDGVNKHHTTIGSHVRTGSDTMFVAPVTVGDGAYTGAGTVVRKDVPPGALAINVAPQRNIDGWAQKKRPGSAAAQAAQAAQANADSAEAAETSGPSESSEQDPRND